MSEYAESIDTILGQEFLTWLWYKSDTQPGAFADENGEAFSVSMEQRIVIQGGNGDAKETTSVVGAFSPFSEARFGLGMGKKVVRALLHIEKDEMNFQMMLKAEDFCFNSVRTPKIDANDLKEEDPDALFLERLFLLETCVRLFDSLYAAFLELRLTSAWQEEVNAIRSWMSEPSERA